MIFGFLWNFWHISHSNKKWGRCDKKMYIAHVKYPLFLSDFNEKLNFRDSFENPHYFSWKYVQWEPSCSMRKDRRKDVRTDMTT